MTSTGTLARLATLFGLLTSICAGGCAVAPPATIPKTTVILMPDEDGIVGAVSVTTATGSQKIDQAYSFATVDGAYARPSDMILMGRESVNKTYDGLLKAQPPKPKSFILHFVVNRTVLTEESKAQIPAVLEAVRERKPTEITIFGHADATGSEKHNIKLSADRANAVANLLRKDDPSLDHIDVQFFGDKAPLVPSDSRTPEPRNRRAEVMIL